MTLNGRFSVSFTFGSNLPRSFYFHLWLEAFTTSYCSDTLGGEVFYYISVLIDGNLVMIVTRSFSLGWRVFKFLHIFLDESFTYGTQKLEIRRMYQLLAIPSSVQSTLLRHLRVHVSYPACRCLHKNRGDERKKVTIDYSCKVIHNVRLRDYAATDKSRHLGERFCCTPDYTSTIPSKNILLDHWVRL